MTHNTPNIHIETLYPAISKKNTDITALIKITHPSMPTTNAVRTKLNVVFALDISGSMGGTLFNSAPIPTPSPRERIELPIFNPAAPSPWPLPGQPMQQPQFNMLIDKVNTSAFGAQQQPFQYATKLSRVKDAAIKALSQLNSDDRFGVVVFDGRAAILVPTSFATDSVKALAIAAIQGLRPGSSTALHAGWKQAAELVCKNLDSKTVNRVLLLTDGEATDGICDIETLASHARTMASHGVTTSTFGVGDQYNETLLQTMAENGDGRYYYLEGDSNFEQIFYDEFQGMSRLYGRDARLRVHASPDTALTFHNALPVTADGWKLPNAIYEKVEYYLVTLKPKKVTTKRFEFMISYDFKHENTIKTVKIGHSMNVLTQKQLDALLVNDNVALKQLELETAHAKEKAMQALDQGNYVLSKNILRASANSIVGSAYAAAPSLMAQTSRLETLMSVGDTGDHKKMRKMTMFDAYSTRNNYDES